MSSSSSRKAGSAATVDAPVLDPFSPEATRAWVESLVESGVLTPDPVFLPSAAMAETAAMLAGRGFKTTVADEDKTRLEACRTLVKGKGASLQGAIASSPLDIKPWHLGHIRYVVDHAFLETLAPEDRFTYANRVARIVPTRELFVGVFRIGFDRGPAGPRAVTMENFRKLVFRYFIPEVWEPVGPTIPGEDQAWRGVLRRKWAHGPR